MDRISVNRTFITRLLTNVPMRGSRITVICDPRVLKYYVSSFPEFSEYSESEESVVLWEYFSIKLLTSHLIILSTPNPQGTSC